MARFTYTSRNLQGQRLTAVAEAESRQSLLARLKEQGLTVIDLKETEDWAAPAKPERRFRLGPRRSIASIRTADLALFWREFAAMVAAGLPVVDALSSVLEELEHARLHKVLSDVVSHLWEGFSLSQSLKRHPKVFSPMITALIGSAEESGNLPKIAEQIAAFLEKRDRLFRKVRAALTYPIFVLCFFLVMTAVATFWIIPQFEEIYEGLGTGLPPLTETVFKINRFFLAHIFFIFGGIATALLALILWSRRPTGRAVLDRLFLKLPVFGELIRLAGLARFCRTLSTLLEGGIPVSRALEMAQETSGNSVLVGAIRRSREEIIKGGKIAASFKKQGIFPPMMVRMIAAGEETGSLSGLLDGVSDYYESRVDAVLTTINALIEPVMIVVIGVFVAIFVLAMYMPVFNLARAMHG